MLVLCAEDEDEAGGLGVEGAWDVGEGLLDELFDPGVGNWGRRGEGVMCPSRCNNFHERNGISHGDGRCMVHCRVILLVQSILLRTKDISIDKEERHPSSYTTVLALAMQHGALPMLVSSSHAGSFRAITLIMLVIVQYIMLAFGPGHWPWIFVSARRPLVPWYADSANA